MSDEGLNPTPLDLLREFADTCREKGWDIEWNWRDGDGITESASYELYLDSVEGIKEHGR